MNHDPNCAASDAACFACEVEAEYADYLLALAPCRPCGQQLCAHTLPLTFDEYAEMMQERSRLWL